MHNPRVGCTPAPDGAYHQHHRAEVPIDLVKPFLDRTNERRAVEDGKDDIEVFEVPIYQV